MALSIGVSAGDLIRVGEHEVQVKSLSYRENLIVVSVDGKSEHVISELGRVELLPEVFVFSGKGDHGGISRLAFEAPRSIRITRNGNVKDREKRRA